MLFLFVKELGTPKTDVKITPCSRWHLLRGQTQTSAFQRTGQYRVGQLFHCEKEARHHCQVGS